MYNGNCKKQMARSACVVQIELLGFDDRLKKGFSNDGATGRIKLPFLVMRKTVGEADYGRKTGYSV